MTLDTRERGLQRMLADMKLYAAHCLSIADKTGQKVPFAFNKAQDYLHEKLEKQITETGKVRALVLKGRQQGISTYVGARFYKKTSTEFGKNAFIVAHEQKATNNLFKMVKRYHDNNPLAPSTSATNATELVFNILDGGYKLATAGSKDVGRSNTAQLLHGSEFGFWDNAQSHLAGIGNTIGDQAGSEIILESTGNGLGNAFHNMWQDAEAGLGEYIGVFIPWFWQPEYRAPVPDGFELSEDDLVYQAVFGLDLAQMAWRRNKTISYGRGFEWLFDQEYPATPSLAFRSATADPLISPMTVMAAVNRRGFKERNGPLIIACDPAEYGPDRTAVCFRQGRTVFRLEAHSKKGPMEVAGLLASYYAEFQPDALFIDKIGIGSGIHDRLLELNIPCIGVISGAKANDNEIYANKRAEMWWRMKAWLEDEPNRLPNSTGLIADLSAPGHKHDSSGRKLLESKESMKRRQIRSPDMADALALTFSEIVVARPGSGSNPYPQARAATSAGY